METWDATPPVRGTAILLHGVMAHAATWWRIGPELARRGWRTTAVDLPGHGHAPRLAATPNPPGDGTPDRDGVPDLDGIVERLAERLPPRADLLVGHSLGAIVALTLMRRRPGYARAVVVEDPPGARHGELAELLAGGIEADGETVRRDPDALVRRERAANPTWAEEDVTHSVEGIALADAPAVARALRAPLRWDLPALLSEVPEPVLLLAADPVRSALGHDREAARRALPPGRFVALDGGHCLHRDLPDRWLAEVDAFLAGIA